LTSLEFFFQLKKKFEKTPIAPTTTAAIAILSATKILRFCSWIRELISGADAFASAEVTDNVSLGGEYIPAAE
jgi:hypothetical protein